MNTEPMFLPNAASLRESRAHIARVQIRRRLALWLYGLSIATILPFVGSYWDPGSLLHESIEQVGMLLIIAAILGRAWCALYIGGRKSNELVADGPYSVSRNPLYLFSMIGVIGVGAQAGSLLLGPLLCVVVWLVFRRVIAHEEVLLTEVFGQPFKAYCARVPRFGPRLSAWQGSGQLTVQPGAVWRTVRDAIPFVLVVPLFELVDRLQVGGHLHVLFRLP